MNDISWRCIGLNLGPSGEKIPAKVTRTPVDGQHVEFTPREVGKMGSNLIPYNFYKFLHEYCKPTFISF